MATNSQETTPFVQVWRNCRLVSMTAGSDLIENATIITHGERIAFAGPSNDAPETGGEAAVTDLGGRLVAPAPIDCHTHIVHGGNRSLEFEMRLEGASYLDIAKAGGGIVSTVRATRALSVDELVAEALPRVDALLAEGTSTIEIKSGYGLTIEAEMRMLQAARQIATLRPVRVLTSYLGAHAVPQEFAGGAATISSRSCCPACSKLTRPVWSMPLTASAKALLLPLTKWRWSSTKPPNWACR